MSDPVYVILVHIFVYVKIKLSFHRFVFVSAQTFARFFINDKWWKFNFVFFRDYPLRLECFIIFSWKNFLCLRFQTPSVIQNWFRFEIMCHLFLRGFKKDCPFLVNESLFCIIMSAKLAVEKWVSREMLHFKFYEIWFLFKLLGFIALNIEESKKHAPQSLDLIDSSICFVL